MADYILENTNRDTYNEFEVRNLLCQKYPEFNALGAGPKHQHSRGVLRQLVLKGKIWTGKSRVPLQVDKDRVTFTSEILAGTEYKPNPVLSRTALYSKPKYDLHHQFEYLLQLYQKPQSTWLIDTEFFSLTGNKVPVAFSISVRTMTGVPLLYERINYNTTMQEMFLKIKRWMTKDTRAASSRLKLFKNTFLKQYGNDRTQGKTISEIRSDVLALGYTPEHTILSWSSNYDLHIFYRILKGGDDIVADRDTEYRTNCVNLLELCKNMRPEESVNELDASQLSDFHRLLFPNQVFHYHDAQYDTLALAQIVHMIVHMIVHAE